MPLLNSRGEPIDTSMFTKKSPPKFTGEAPGNWAGRNDVGFGLPGGGMVQFNLDNLTLADFRTMRDHYQVNASLSVLTFMIHQSDWKVVCKNKKIEDHCNENMEKIWTRLVRAISQSYWAGYAPNSLQWENDPNGATLQLTKIKDLPPEECHVNWHTEEITIPGGKMETQGGLTVAGGGMTVGSTKAKVRTYNGIIQRGWPRPIPTENSFWYPLLMENGNYYGKKLLRSAFQSWFFSIMIHMFSNRYFERFGEPVPIGRAPYDNEVEVDGKVVKGNKMMETVLTQLRNRSVVVLPNDIVGVGDNGRLLYEYEIEYLESQMRGADFERYLTRLDEEISLALFTPLLILRTSDVGSYNLGVGHMQIYLNMLNAILGDLKEYVDRYILGPMVNFNFSEKADRAEIKFRQQGKENVETIRAVMNELTRSGKIMPDLEELGQITGLSLKEVKVVTEPPAEPGAADPTPAVDPAKKPSPTGTGQRVGDTRAAPRGPGSPRATGRKINARLAPQVEKAFRENTFGTETFKPECGFARALEASLVDDHGTEAPRIADEFIATMDAVLLELVSLGREEWETPEAFMAYFSKSLDLGLKAL